MSGERRQDALDAFDTRVRALFGESRWADAALHAKTVREKAIEDDPTRSSVETLAILRRAHNAAATAYISLGNYPRAIREYEGLVRLPSADGGLDQDRHGDYAMLARLQLRANLVPPARRSLYRSIACVLSPRTVELVAITLSDLSALERAEGLSDAADCLEELSRSIRRERRRCPNSQHS